MPVYHVKTPTSEHLVKAEYKGQAVSHVVKATVQAESINTDRMVELLTKGLQIEEAAPSKEEAPNQPELPVPAKAA